MEKRQPYKIYIIINSINGVDFMCFERTDMAIEAAAIFNKPEEEIKRIKGVEITEERKEGIVITRVSVKDSDGADAIGKPVGDYITVDTDGFLNTGVEFRDRMSETLSEQLSMMLKPYGDNSLFVVGLGNKDITPDALGPKVAEGIYVTRHLFDELPQYIDENTKSVCAISPGVLGNTGIETLEVIKGIVQRISPSVVICIDALATRSMERLFSSVQFANTGITPGAGVGNRRNAINRDTLGVPVIAIGVPTVVDGATIANDSISLLIKAVEEHASSSERGFIGKIDHEKRYSLVKEILKPYSASLIVTPKEIDSLIDDMSYVLSKAINNALGNE